MAMPRCSILLSILCDFLVELRLFQIYKKVCKLPNILREGEAHCWSSPEKKLTGFAAWLFREATARIPTPKSFSGE